MNITIIVTIILAFIVLWWLIGKFPDAFVKTFPFIKNEYLNKKLLHVFSAETSNGDEAEFINESLIDKDKAIKIFRIILSLIFFILIIWLLNN